MLLCHKLDSDSKTFAYWKFNQIGPNSQWKETSSSKREVEEEEPLIEILL